MLKVLSLPAQPHIEKVFRPHIWETIKQEFNVTENPNSTQLNHEQLLEKIGEYDAIITGWGSPKVGRDGMEAAPKLKLIAHSAGSVKFLFDDATIHEVVRPRGLKIYSGNEAIAYNVAESTIGMMIAATHRWPEHMAAFKEHKRRSYAHPPINGPYLLNSVVGLVSASKVGRLVIQFLQPFGCEILVYDPFLTDESARSLGVKKVELDELFSRSDIVSVHAPSIDATNGLITAAHIKQMKDGAAFINTSRGSVLDQDALLEECRSGRIVAALDVTTPEPLPADSPFWELPNVMLIPHLAGAGFEGYFRIGDGVLEALRGVAQDKPFAGDVPLDKWETLA